MSFKQELRIRIWNKFEQKCAYCGCDLDYNKMQVDHKKPLYRNDSDKTLKYWGINRGTDNESNLYPSCARCNRWKATYSVEMFRDEIEKQIERLKRDSNQFRMAVDFGLIEETEKPVVFWFETCKR